MFFQRRLRREDHCSRAVIQFPDAFPAVTVPGSRNGVLNLARSSSVVEGRGCSSVSIATGVLPFASLACTRTISSPKPFVLPHRTARALLAAEGKGVLLRAADLIGSSATFSAGSRHGIDAILRLQKGVYEAPADRGVEHIRRTLERCLRLAHERRARASWIPRRLRLQNRFPRCGWPGAVVPTASRPEAQRRFTVAPQGTVSGSSTTSGGHARDIAIVFACLIGAAEDLPRRAPPNRASVLRAIKAIMDMAARSSARTCASAPPKRPIGVRTASQIKASGMSVASVVARQR